MFKAFLRTDGTVVVTGGDSAWKFQQRQFQRLVTSRFAYYFLRQGEEALISDLSAEQRTISIRVQDFIGAEVSRVSDSEYQFCRAVLKKLVERKGNRRSSFADVG